MPRRKRTIIQIYVYNIIVCIQYLYVLTRFTVVFSDEEKMTSSTFDFSDISTEEPDLVEKLDLVDKTTTPARKCLDFWRVFC